jgi:hypothetical protein
MDFEVAVIIKTWHFNMKSTPLFKAKLSIARGYYLLFGAMRTKKHYNFAIVKFIPSFL